MRSHCRRRSRNVKYSGCCENAKTTLLYNNMVHTQSFGIAKDLEQILCV